MTSTFFLFMFAFLSMHLLTESTNQDGGSQRGARSTGDASYFYYKEATFPRDCQEVYSRCEDGSTESGVYTIQPEGADEPFKVYCNNSIDGGGWTVIQRRIDGSVEFYRDWDGYKQGFGFLMREFWLGNDKISLLTNQKKYMLRIDIHNQDGDHYFAKYDLFRISDEETKYRLVDLGEFDSSSTTGFDAMANNRNQSFTTHDRDNDLSRRHNRARYCHGAWWFRQYCYCVDYPDEHDAHLNGLFNPGTSGKSMCWRNLPGGQSNLRYSEMKIRPI